MLGPTLVVTRKAPPSLHSRAQYWSNQRSRMKDKSGKSFVSAQQVAELAGVSRSAVSRTFTEGASVSKATRDKVMAAADTLGYHVNHLARGLIQENSNIVCLVAADMASPYQSKFIEILTRDLQAANKVVMIVNASGDSGVNRALRQTLYYRADASVVLSGQPDEALIETCVRSGQRVIVANRDQSVSGTENIMVSNRASAREAFHMLHRVGCQTIALVASDVGTPSLLARETAFVEEAKAQGVDVTVTRSGASNYASGAEVARRLFSGQNRPDGAFCITDLLACGFMDVARNEFGLKVPEELCVIGFDDIEQAGWSSYNLTTFRQPLDEITQHITQLINEPQPAHETLPPPTRFVAHPVWRGSVRPR